MAQPPRMLHASPYPSFFDDSSGSGEGNIRYEFVKDYEACLLVETSFSYLSVLIGGKGTASCPGRFIVREKVRHIPWDRRLDVLYTPDYFRYKEVLLYTTDYFRYKRVLLYTPIYFRYQVRCSANKAKHHLRAHLCRHKQRHEAWRMASWEGCSSFMESGASVPRCDDHKAQCSSALCLEAVIQPFSLIGWRDIHLIFWLASLSLISYLSCRRSSPFALRLRIQNYVQQSHD